MTTALFAGSFDPFTIGHRDIVERALPLFDRVVVAVGYNEHKRGMFPVEDRVAMIQKCFSGVKKIEVASYTGLTADFAKSVGAGVLLRGVRSAADFETERNLADANRAVSGLDTVLLLAAPELGFVSSSMVRELLHNGCDVSRFLA